MNEVLNPFLDGTDDEELTVAGVAGHDTHPAAHHWGKPRTAAKKAADAKLRAEGKVPAGQKRRQGERRDFNEKDFLIMKAMLKFRYLTAHMIAQILGVTYQTANGRLVGLRKKGLVGSHRFSNSNTVWFVKEAGMRVMRNQGVELPEKYTLMNEDRIGTEKYDHELAVNQVAIHLLTGGNTMMRWDESLPLDRLITEKELKKAFPNAQLKGDTIFGAGTIAEKAKIEAVNRLKNRTLKVTEITTEYPMLWIPTTRSGSPVPAKQVSPPDLVINKEDLRVGSSLESVAIEVELHSKSVEEYMKIMETYRQNRLIYGGVAWYISKESIGKKITEAATAVKFPMDKLAICMLMGKDGEPYVNSASL
jgi:hypothetical protein